MQNHDSFLRYIGRETLAFIIEYYISIITKCEQNWGQQSYHQTDKMAKFSSQWILRYSGRNTPGKKWTKSVRNFHYLIACLWLLRNLTPGLIHQANHITYES